jgi:S1 RNA binding domain protein
MAELGSIVKGVVDGVTKFGAFINFGDGESGLVHISELSYDYITDINEFFKKGDEVSAKVIKIDDKGKISLSIKQAQSKPQKPKKSSPRPDSFDWTAREEEELSFEDRMSRFKHESEEILRDNKRRMENKRSGGYSRKSH